MKVIKLNEADIKRLHRVYKYSFIQLAKRFNCPEAVIKEKLEE